MLFKVDFEKAFDFVNWKYLDFVQNSLGFGSKWRTWIKACLESARTSILVNGAPTSEFSVKRGLIRGVKIGDSDIQLSHLFYANDVVITTEWNSHDMDNIIRVLRANWTTLIDRFLAKLSAWKANLFSIGGRLTLIKAILGSLGMYYFSIFKVPESILKNLESIRALFFWGGSHSSQKLAWVKWLNVLASMFSHPNVLWVKVIKALHGQKGGFDHHGCKTNGLWAKIVGSSNHLHSSDMLLLVGSLRFTVGCGTLVCFWKDKWLGDSPLFLRFNRLCRLEQNKDCLIIDRISNGQWCWSWSRPDIGVRNTSSLFTLLSEIGNMVLAPVSDSCVWPLLALVFFLLELLAATLTIIYCLIWTVRQHGLTFFPGKSIFSCGA
nr:hypothetical protein [Tanacetum cinerariifolium]